MTEYEIEPGGERRELDRSIDASGEVRASANLSTHLRRVDRQAPTEERVVQWTNGTAGARRVHQPDTSYEPYRESPTPRLTHHYLVPQMVSRGDWSVDSIDGDRVVLTTDFHPEHGDLRSFEGRMVVDSAGRIHQLEVTVTTSNVDARSEETHHVLATRHFVYEVSRVGNVSVPAPDWLDEAREELDDE